MDQPTKQDNAPLKFSLKLKKEITENLNLEHLVHKYGNGIVCGTDGPGFPTPGNKSGLELVLDASDGFIPLWAQGHTLRWTFDPLSLSFLENPEETANYFRNLFGQALKGWGNACPIRFQENADNSDFQVSIQNLDHCHIYGCTMARAFFPDSGRHNLTIFPKLFELPMEKQIEILQHELGHIFGLRHFFAKIKEQFRDSELFGKQSAFTIMNYGAESTLTEQDKTDLELLYRLAWSGELKEINGTPIKLVVPFHALNQAG